MMEQLLFTEMQIGRLAEIAGELLNSTKAKIFLIQGAMGSGKTTLIKEMCRSLGSGDEFSSPTFSIVNEYRYPKGKIYHFDLYRLKSQEELLDIGIEEYLDSGEYCFVEWPSLVEELLESDHVKVQIEVNGEKRFISALSPATGNS